MSRLKPIQFNFTAGELAPRLYGASHLTKYWNAVETLENFIILPYGGVQRRDGLHYVCAQGDETRKVRLIPFIFSTEQAYIIEAGHEYMRFYMNHGQIQEDEPTDVLLCHMNGTDGSQSFIDDSDSAHTVTAHGTAQVDTAYQKFGSGSVMFSGAAGCYLSVPDHADFDFSADDIFTIEMWIRPSANIGTLCSQSTDANNGFYIRHHADGNISFSVGVAAAWQTLTTTTAPVTPLSWLNHIRIVGDGTNYYLFVNGHLEVGEAITSSMLNYTGDLFIGRDITGVSYYYGWIDEFRIVPTAISTADFAPPTSQYPLDTSAVEIVSPYLEGDLPLLKYFQSYDTMYIFHPDHAWRKLTRTAHDTWSLDKIDFTNGPWLEEKTDIVFTPSAVTGDIDLTSDAAFFYDGHVDALLRLKQAATWGYVKITAVTNTTTATATVIETLASIADTDAYQEGAWSGVKGYPSCGIFNEESLVAAANDNQPQTIWASQKGDYENFEAGTDDADAFIYTIPASNRILWVGALREMILGTGEGSFKMTGGMDDYISPTNVRVRPGMAIGSTSLGPIPVNNSLLFWQKGGRKLRELTYDPNSYDEGYVAPDLTLLSDHITLGGVKYSAWQQEPNSILWTVRADGVLLSMTYMRPEEIVGWGRHITDGVVESVAVIPDPTDSFNEGWVSVKRTIDGATQRYIEYMDPDMMVDSGLTYSGSPVYTVSGLDHLEGETVDMVGDDVVYDQALVAGGIIYFSPAASEIQIGLPYTSKLITVKPTMNVQDGTTAGLPKKWAELFVSVHETSGLTINSGGTDEIIDFRAFSDVGLGEAIPLYTGDVRVSQLGWVDGRVTIEHDDPLPCTILGVFGVLEIGN